MTNPAAISSVCIVGLGYIGLPTAAMLASCGIDVIGVDVNLPLVEAINAGKHRVLEPDLQGLLNRALASGKLRATTTPQAADAFLIAVPTPLTPDRRPDLQHVYAAVAAVAPHLKIGDLLIVESTSPVGTCEKVLDRLAVARPDLRLPQLNGEAGDIYLAYCPERVLPGQIVNELAQTDRIIGGITATCAERAAGLYRLFANGELLLTDARTAEMVKLSENAFRDVNIAFANELSMICDQLDIDVGELIKLANRHPRVNILQPGCGVGGHCIAVDPWFIVDQSPEQARLIRSARQVNDDKPYWVVGKVDQAVQELSRLMACSEITIACFGLAYKADSDDLRESPAVKIVQILAAKYPGQVVAVEPNLSTLPQALTELGVRLVSIDEALRCRVLLRLVGHREFGDCEWPVAFGQRIVIV